MNPPLSLDPADPRQGPAISLVLGSGGARGYAHIGVIEALHERGYAIRSVAGSSMGALVGGVYAAGRLEAYRDWACSLQRLDVLRLVDWSWRGGGLIKGRRIIETLRELVGDVDIERLPISYTAVAVDIDAEREVWFSRGPLFDAIRASISIPSVFRPHEYEGRRLVDGGLLNPVPITPTLRDLTDFTVAVDVNAPDQRHGDLETPIRQPERQIPALPTGGLLLGADGGPAPSAPAAGTPRRTLGGYRRQFAQLFDTMLDRRSRAAAPEDGGARGEVGMVELFARSLDTVQATLTRFKLAAQPPDLLIRIPREACAFYEFHRAEELIAIGRDCARRALAAFHPPETTRGNPG